MGLDLRLLPFDADDFSHTVLSCSRRGALFDEILKLPAVRVPESLFSYLCRDDEYEEEHYGNTQKTPYGEALKYVLAEQLLPFASHSGVTEPFKNRAIWAYLAELPSRTKVALYWH